MDVLEGMSPRDRLNYSELLTVLGSRFMNGRGRQLHYAELQGRRQQPRETFQELGADIERKTRKSFRGSSSDVLDQVATPAFMYAVRDQEIQRAVHWGQTATVREALVLVLGADTTHRATEHALATAPSKFCTPGYEVGVQAEAQSQQCFRCHRGKHFAKNCPEGGATSTRRGSASAGSWGRARR